jgi:hypothetical protein
MEEKMKKGGLYHHELSDACAGVTVDALFGNGPSYNRPLVNPVRLVGHWKNHLIG